MLEFLLYLAAFVCFALAAVGVGAVRIVALVPLGLALWVLVSLVEAWPG
jgi:hypothetical protein